MKQINCFQTRAIYLYLVNIFTLHKKKKKNERKRDKHESFVKNSSHYIMHTRAFQNRSSDSNYFLKTFVWETCRRRVYRFSDKKNAPCTQCKYVLSVKQHLHWTAANYGEASVTHCKPQARICTFVLMKYITTVLILINSRLISVFTSFQTNVTCIYAWVYTLTDINEIDIMHTIVRPFN